MPLEPARARRYALGSWRWGQLSSLVSHVMRRRHMEQQHLHALRPCPPAYPPSASPALWCTGACRGPPGRPPCSSCPRSRSRRAQRGGCRQAGTQAGRDQRCDKACHAGPRFVCQANWGRAKWASAHAAWAVRMRGGGAPRILGASHEAPSSGGSHEGVVEQLRVAVRVGREWSLRARKALCQRRGWLWMNGGGPTGSAAHDAPRWCDVWLPLRRGTIQAVMKIHADSLQFTPCAIALQVHVCVMSAAPDRPRKPADAGISDAGVAATLQARRGRAEQVLHVIMLADASRTGEISARGVPCTVRCCYRR